MRMRWKRVAIGVTTISIAGVAYAQTRTVHNLSPSSNSPSDAAIHSLNQQVQSLDHQVTLVQTQLKQATDEDAKSVSKLKTLQSREISMQKQILIHQAELRQEAELRHEAELRYEAESRAQAEAQAVSRASG